MTRRWTDYPLSRFIPIKKIHNTELQKADEERIRVLRNDSDRTTSNFPLPTFYYDKPNSKLWGIDYPKADPAHWPPNHIPDNRVRNDHITGARGMIEATGSASDYISAYPSIELYRQFCKEDGRYKAYTSIADIIGATWTDGSLIAGTTLIKAVHVNELRDAFEKLNSVIILPATYAYRRKVGVSSWKSTKAAAWTGARTAFLSASWGDWTGGSGDLRLKLTFQQSGSLYQAMITAQELKHTFDLDLEISDMDWTVLPPLSASLICYGIDTRYQNTTGVFAKCTTTGDTAVMPMQNADGRGYLLVSDITSYVGSGHGSEEFMFSAINEYSSDEIDLLDHASGLDTQILVSHEEGKPDTGYGTIANIYIVIVPDWHHGAP